MDAHAITSEAELREIIGAEVPGLADKNIDYLDSYAKEFIARSPFLVLATCSKAGGMDASPKGDHPGFVEVADDRTLLVPDRPGNKLAYGHLNVLDNPRVGMIFMIPGTRETLRINGHAELTKDPAILDRLSAREKPATLAMRVTVEEAFFHCAKAFIRSGLWQPDSWAEPMKISFGEMFAARKEMAGEEAKQVSTGIDQAIEVDYENNL